MIILGESSQLRKTVAILTLEMKYPGGTGGPLTRPVINYHRKLEDRFFALCRRKDVERSGTSAHGFESDDGKRWWVEDFTLRVETPKLVEPMAERIIQLVRKMSFIKDHSFNLQKQVILDEHDNRDVYNRRIYPSRNAKWIKYEPELSLKKRSRKTTEFPPNLKYLAPMAGRCDGIGGNDIYGLFDKESELESFLNGLSRKDRDELIEIYKTIVRKKHHDWYRKWLEDNEESLDEEFPQWCHEFGWFLAVLDRLREGGLLDSTRGKAKQTELLYWGDQ